MTTTSKPVTNTVVLRGVVTSAEDPKELESGDLLVRCRVTTREEGERAVSVPVAWIGGAKAAPTGLEAGVEVFVLGRVQTRWWQGGGPGGGRTSMVEVRASHVIVATERRRIVNALKKVMLDAA